MVLLLLLQLGLILIKHVTGAPPADCIGANAGDLMTDSSNCQNFYLCMGDDTFHEPSFPCPEEYLCFDHALSDCSADATACETACASVPGSCKTQCVNQGDHIADPYNCNKHYICLSAGDQHPVEEHCFPDRPFFNGIECVADESECCTCQIPDCVAAGELYPDPFDCHQFYACVPIGGDIIMVGPSPCDNGGSYVVDGCDDSVKQCTDKCGSGVQPTPTKVPTITTGNPAFCQDLNAFTCNEGGYFARCPFCDKSYFHCDHGGSYPTEGYCSGTFVFNPDPMYPICVDPRNCPYHPLVDSAE